MKIDRNNRYSARLCYNHFGITAIAVNARNGLILAIDEVAAATVLAMPAMACHITHARPLSFFPALHARPYGVDFSDHFMAWNARVSESGKTTFNRKSIGVANATGLDTDSDLPKGRLDDCSLNDFKLARFRYLHSFIGPTHKFPFVFAFACNRTGLNPISKMPTLV